MQKRIFSLILAMLMIIGGLSACSGEPEATNIPSAKPTESGVSADPGEDNGDDGQPTTFVCEEPETVTVWEVLSSTYITSVNDSHFVDWLAEATNVTLDFQHPSAADAATAFNLMVVSEEYCDIIRPGQNTYVGGFEKGVADGVFMDLTDLLEAYAPNYAAIRAKGGDYEKMTIADSGMIFSIYTMNDPAEYPWTGLGLRQDILDDKGLDLPVTLQDWEECLYAFKESGVEHPLLINYNGIFFNSEFMSAWNIGKDFYNVDGEVRYGYIQPEFKDYLAHMNDWYRQGLIDQDFPSRGIVMFAMGDSDTMINRGEAAAASTIWGLTANQKVNSGSTEIEDFWMAAVSAPKMNEGDTIHFRYKSDVAKTPNLISATCEKPEIALGVMDYLFTEEGSMLLNYGKEGVSYTMIDGVPRYTDEILHDEAGVAPREVARMYTWDDGIGLVDFKRLWQAYDETSPASLEAYDVWNQDECDYVLPPITMTEQEGSEYSNIIGDINTYVNETVPAFIMGSKPISEFDAFVEQLKLMGIEDAIRIQQDALDRYNAR